MEANANTGYEFENWTNSDDEVASTNAEYTFEMPAENVELTANFALIDFTVSVAVQPQDAGTITGEGTYNMGDNVTLEASANTGYEFVNWTDSEGEIVFAEAEYTFVMPAENVELTANFVQVYSLTLNITPVNSGNVEGAGLFAEDEEVTITATPNTGYEFIHWTDSGDEVVSVDAEYTFNMPADDITLTANFQLEAEDSYILSLLIEPQDAGTVTGQGAYIEGADVTVTASANTGYEFVNWTDSDDEVVSTDAEYTFEMPAENLELTAIFALIDYTVSVAVQPEDAGTITGEGTYNVGDNVTLGAIANTGYDFVNWTDSDDEVVSTDAEYTFEMPAENVELTAIFALIDYTVSVAVQPEDAGTITGEGTYNMGDNVILEAIANTGYEFVNWTDSDNEVVSTDAEYTFEMPAENIELTVVFTYIDYNVSVTVQPEDAGTITGDGTYNMGDEVTLEASANTGYEFVNWTESDNEVVSTDAEYTFEMPAENVELTANFVITDTGAEPLIAAPTPPAREPEDVISVFSDAYTNLEGTDFNPGWGQSTVVTFVDIDGSETMKYENFNYQGTQFSEPINASQMEYLNVDMWTADATTVNVYCISEGPVETPFSLAITPNEWVTYQIPLSAFDPVNMSALIQFKFDGGDGSQTIYLDNLYFFREEVEEGSDATLSDLMVDGTTVAGFTPNVFHYDVVLPEGTTDAPVVTASTNDPDATAVVTPATELPGTTNVLVTSANEEVERTYTVSFSVQAVADGPRNPIDFEPGGFGADWTWTVFENGPNDPLEIITNPDQSGINTSANVAKFTALESGANWAGVESSHGDEDLGTFFLDETNNIIKIMVWKPVISPVGIKLATASGWAQPEILVSNTVTNEWEELTFDFSNVPNHPDGEMYDQIIIFPDFAPRDQDNIVYFDNITFNAFEFEPGIDATLSDLQVDGTTIGGFSPLVFHYDVVLPEGTTDVPTVTAVTNDPDATAEVTPATELPGTTSVLVTSANSEVEQTYTIAFTVETPVPQPEVAAPTPPARDPDDVISIFSDAYTNVPDTDFFPDWGQSTAPSIIEVGGSQTLMYANFNYQGTQFAEPVNASAMEFLHLDMWTSDATSVNVFCISEGPVETGFALNITPNQWVSYDIPLSAFDPVDMSAIIQFKFDGGDGTQTIYLDNLYFFRDATSAGYTEEQRLVIYPNPAQAGSTLHLSTEVLQVDIFDLSGKIVASGRNTSALDTYGMKHGIYMVRIITHSGTVETHRLVVK